MGGKFIATALLVATTVSAQTPNFDARIAEIRNGQCLGNGFDLQADIVLYDHELSRIVVKDTCANEKNGIESIAFYKGTVVCECPQYRALAEELFSEARTLAWEQNRERFAQSLIAELKKTKPQLLKEGRVYITNPAYVPEGDVAHLAYGELTKGNAIYLYTYAYIPEGARAKLYVDVPPFGKLDAVAENSAAEIDKAYGAIRTGKVPLRKPSLEEKGFYESYFKDVSTGRVPLYGGRDPKECVDPWICKENPWERKR